jgi:hypothetical protein
VVTVQEAVSGRFGTISMAEHYNVMMGVYEGHHICQTSSNFGMKNKGCLTGSDCLAEAGISFLVV